MRALAGIALLLALGCVDAPRGPVATVERYFEVLARDPMRTLELVTPDFHLSHALPAWRPEDRPGQRAPDPGNRPPIDPQVAVEDGRVGWLNAQIPTQVQTPLREMVFELSEERVGQQDALVVVTVQPAIGARFLQRFFLTRNEGVWLIDRIEQEGPAGSWNEMARYAAYPNEALARRLLDRAKK